MITIYIFDPRGPFVVHVMESKETPSTTEQEGNPDEPSQNGTILGSSQLSLTDTGDSEPEHYSANETSTKSPHKARFELTSVASGNKIRLRRLSNPTRTDGADSNSSSPVATGDTRPSTSSRNIAKTSRLLQHDCPFKGCTVHCYERENMLQHIRNSHPGTPPASFLTRPLIMATSSAQNALRSMTSIRTTIAR